jgi:glycosyltransferase involved in cell wall biosynthesis
VARELASATIVYLPYPDGVSERRGTLLAALGNGAAVVTTDGPFRPQGLERAVRFASNPHSAVRLIAILLGEPRARAALREAGRAYAAVRDWAEIARQHIQIYQRLGASRAFGRIAEAAE